MDDLVCGVTPDNSYYKNYLEKEAKKSSQPEVAEENMCTPMKQDSLTTSTNKSTKIVNDYRFVNNEKPVSGSENLCIDHSFYLGQKEQLSPSLFHSNLSNSKVLMNLDLEMIDQNGLNNLGEGDLKGKINNGQIDINREVFSSALFSLKGFSTKDGNRTTSVKNVYFNPQERAYVFDLNVEQKALSIPVFWDNFKIKFAVNQQGQLSAKLQENWLPDEKIIDKLAGIVKEKIKNSLPEKYKNIQVELKKEKDKLTIIPQIQNLEVPITENSSFTIDRIDSKKAGFTIDQTGNLKINLDNVDISGSSAKKAGNKPENSSDDKIRVNVSFGLNKNDQQEVFARGNMRISLDNQETKKIVIGNESLGNYLKSGKILNEFSVYLQKDPGKNPEISSKNYVLIKDAEIEGSEQKIDVMTSLKLDFNQEQEISLDFDESPPKPISINPVAGGVELFVNGREYFPEMKKMIKEAKSSIDLETFMLHNDQAGNEISYLLARKAAGLGTEKNLAISRENPSGVKIRFIFNSWKGEDHGGAESEKVITNSIEKVEKEIKQAKLTPAQKEKAIKNLRENYQWKFFDNGVLRSDHRKVFVVDGAQATVGGMNLGSQYLSDNAYHDTMIKIAGPEVRNVHKEFLENWFEFNNLPQPSESQWSNLLKSEEQLKKDWEKLKTSGNFRDSTGMATLVTDDRQTDIERGILQLITKAKKEINIEQAFFSHDQINKSLEEAIKRGVKVNVIVAEKSLNSIFDYANLYSVYQLTKLKEQGAKGEVKLFYYNNNQAPENKYIHTKAISVDGEKAIIGSANMIGRSLNSPFTKIDKDGGSRQTLYNKELSLYLEDPGFVRQINSRLFENDMVNHSQELSSEEIKQLVNKLGGEKELKKKALIAKLT